MSCSRCEKAIEGALGAIDGVLGVEASRARKLVQVEVAASSESLVARLKAQIEEEGFDVV